MSIYPVPLASWYRKDKDKWDTIVTIAKQSVCCRCGKTPKATAMIAHHSLPWGYYDEVWCSSRCFRRKPRTRYFEKQRVLERMVAKMYPSSLYGQWGLNLEGKNGPV